MTPFPRVDPAAPCTTGDPDRFYPRTGDHRAAAKAARECAACPCRGPCLRWALRYEDHGVWGGTTAPQRQNIRKRIGMRLEPAPHPWLPIDYKRRPA
jgi:hypothetical protein